MEQVSTCCLRANKNVLTKQIMGFLRLPKLFQVFFPNRVIDGPLKTEPRHSNRAERVLRTDQNLAKDRRVSETIPLGEVIGFKD